MKFHTNKTGKLRQYSYRIFEEVVTRSYRLSGVRYLARPFFKIPETNKWIFVVGCYNSGTTLLQNLIGSHNEISTMPREGVRFTSLLPQPEDLGWTRMWIKCPTHMQMTSTANDTTYHSIQSDWAPMWTKKQAKARLEKSITNVTRMKWLDECFPNTYFIGIWRNGYCVSEGIRRRARPKPKTNYPSDTYPIELTAQQWLQANYDLIEGSNLVKRYTGFSYESLIQNPIKTLEKLFDFLELPTPDMQLHEKTISIENRTFSLKNQNQNSIDRLTGDEIQSINEVISTLQLNLGYEILKPDPIG